MVRREEISVTHDLDDGEMTVTGSPAAIKRLSRGPLLIRMASWVTGELAAYCQAHLSEAASRRSKETLRPLILRRLPKGVRLVVVSGRNRFKVAFDEEATWQVHDPVRFMRSLRGHSAVRKIEFRTAAGSFDGTDHQDLMAAIRHIQSLLGNRVVVSLSVDKAVYDRLIEDGVVKRPARNVAQLEVRGIRISPS
jgi:hypothetical protein